MREKMCERGDFLFTQGIGDLRHCRHAATGSHARLVGAQRLEQIILALAGEAGNTEAPPNERGGNGYVLPKATAPHLDSTLVA